MLISRFSVENSNDKVVSEIETQYKIALPQEYRTFLCKYNGGYTPKTKFKVGRVSSDIRGFYGGDSAKLNFQNFNLEEWIESGLFPIACDSFGNYIAISIEEKSYGKIYFCDHEMGNKPSLIDDNFMSFIKRCKSDVISEAAKRSIEEREAALIAAGKGDRITDALRQMWQAEIDKYANMIQEEVVIN